MQHPFSDAGFVDGVAAGSVAAAAAAGSTGQLILPEVEGGDLALIKS